MSEMFDEAMERGKITWHCSEEDGGPDVGMTLGLGDKVLWVGEITNRAYSEGGEDVAALGDHGGWWLYEPDARVLGKFADADTARDFIEGLAASFVAQNAEHRETTKVLREDSEAAQAWYRANEAAIRAAGIVSAPDFMIPF